MNTESFMQLAVELAYRGKGYTKTNPCVGAVIVKDGHIEGRGWHKEYGGNHAEIEALADAGDMAQGADAYVTLEPCTTHGKTPPCADALIAAGIKRVFIGVLDPNPAHAGKAIKVFKEAGIEAVCGVYAQPCAELIEDFTKFKTTGMPYVTLKIAQSLDGKIATHTGNSKWITSEESRRLVHKIRKESDAVLVGIGTAIADDPELTVREMPSDRQPVRIVFDSKCRLPVTSKLVQGAKNGIADTIVVVSAQSDRDCVKALEDNGVRIITAGESLINIHEALIKLGELNIMNILLEGGGALSGSFLKAGCVDSVRIFMAPILIGGDEATGSIGGTGVDLLKDAYKVHQLESTRSGPDFLFQGRINDYTDAVLRLTAGF